MNFPKLYECDPQKNTECNKRNCGNLCKYTTRKEFSREPSEKMTPELAFMVLDVTRRERCEDTPRTRAACNVAQGALYLQMKASPYSLMSKSEFCSTLVELFRTKGYGRASCEDTLPHSFHPETI